MFGRTPSDRLFTTSSTGDNVGFFGGKRVLARAIARDLGKVAKRRGASANFSAPCGGDVNDKLNSDQLTLLIVCCLYKG